MRSFVVEAGNGNGLFGFFEDNCETGYFYLYEPSGAGIIDFLHIHSKSLELKLRKRDVAVLWSNDLLKCGVRVWGRMYGIFDLGKSEKISISIRSVDTLPITDPDLLSGFTE